MLLNLERLNARMAAHGLDAVIATSPENVTYASGYWALSQWIRRGPQTYVVWPAPGKGEPHIIASASLLDLLADQDDVSVSRIAKFGNFVVETSDHADLSEIDRRQLGLYGLQGNRNAATALDSVLSKLGLAGGRIAIDEGGLPPSLEAFHIDGPLRIEAVGGFQLFREVRAVKTEREVERLRRAASIAEASIDAALRIAAPGVSEEELAREFNLETIRQGGLPVLYCIGTGPRSAMPNVQPSSRRLEPGDIIRFDVGGRYRHYRADIARIAVLGEPSEKIRAYHHALHMGVRRGIEMLKPGVRAADIFDAVVETVRREGIPHYRRTHVGHGIGIDGYDLPDLSASSADVIEEGMVLCVETPYYELGFGGLQVEDMVVVRRDGAETLMSSSGALRVIS